MEKIYEEFPGKDEDKVYPKICDSESDKININVIINFTKKCEMLDQNGITKHVLEIARGENEERSHFSVVNKEFKANN